MSLRKRLLAAVAMIQLSTVTSGSPNLTAISLQSPNLNTSPFRLYDDRPDDCPPCFNCLLPAFKCQNYAACDEYNGKCKCPPGFGGDDCLSPVCDSLADGPNRHVRGDDQKCECKDGWTGINCNLCQTDDACGPLMPQEMNGTCYKGGLVVKENFQMCTVTNRKIIDQLDPQIPEVTFSCNKANATCAFQFWVDQKESFTCALDECSFKLDATHSSNWTYYDCKNVKCECIPGRMLCGEDGSIDISDFLKEEIKGPAQFNCNGKKNGCKFEEPAMNELIGSVFGDPSIFLDCDSSECLYYTEVPGYKRPEKPDRTGLIAGTVSGSVVLLLALGLGIWYIARRSREAEALGEIRLLDDEAAKLIHDHTPTTLQFRGVSYRIGDKQILDNIHGIVKPGEVMAIMGASGAGKTSFLDILARKRKKGIVDGEFFLDGKSVSDAQFKRVVGFVDQEDTLMSSLTVYETILYSALLRLPKNMSVAAKKYRVLETMEELGILGIKDTRIGNEGERGISGGEKRRVTIACELVTSPSILFMDEPTSGLDAYNAYNVIECLVTLARDFNRTVVFTIHQPRSNIAALFDQLILLAEGKMVYSGPFSKCQDYFNQIGHPCPPGFNIADYLVDLTMHASRIESPSASTPSEIGISDTESAFPSGSRPTRPRKNSIREWQEHQLYDPRPRSTASDGSVQSLRDEFGTTQQWASVAEESHHQPTSLPPPQNGKQKQRSRKPKQHTQEGETERLHAAEHLATLIYSYENSAISDQIREEIYDAVNANENSDGLPEELPRSKRIGWASQFMILSKRTFKNLYRNPMLMLTHYSIAILMALLCGYLYWQISDDIEAFQNRMGLFFFILALFGFSTLTSLNIFASERILFVRERANGYYSPITYFAAKVMFDIIPLRVLPPIVMGMIIYPMVGLVSGWSEFWSFLLVLVLFNLTSAALCLFIGIIFQESGVANLIGSLVMLFSLLFAGLLLNHDSIPKGFGWIQQLSIFHYAFEALIVNEMRYLTLFEEKYGLQVSVPGASILRIFGFNALAFWKDVRGLGIIFGTPSLYKADGRCFYCACVRGDACVTCGETIDV